MAKTTIQRTDDGAAYNTGAAVIAPVVAAAYVARGASAIVGLGIGAIVITPLWAAETLINKTLRLDREKCPNCGKKRGMPIKWTVPTAMPTNSNPIRHRECRYCGHRQTLAPHESKISKYGKDS
jgi:ribosomal protein S27AE